MKEEVYERINIDGNLYLCHGRFRAFSKKLAKSIRWKKTSGEDAFSYLYCISKGWKFCYAPKAKVIYKLPGNLKDHFRQSVRFINGSERMLKYFDFELVKSSYAIPLKLKIGIFLKYFVKRPILMSSYLGIFCYANILSKFEKRSNSIWETSNSSKQLITG